MSQSYPANRSGVSIRRPRRTAALWSLACLFVVLLAVPMPQAFADDTELLRSNSANPFLFIVLDTSRSMAMSIDDKWLPAGADDPRSRLYIAKEIFYEELQSLSDVQYGLATFNQDEVRVWSKHYLYYVADTSGNAAEIAGMPSGLGGYPVIEPNNEVTYTVTDASTGNTDTVVAIDGDLLTLGRTFPFNALGQQTVPGGTCADPLDLTSDRDAINRYPKFGESGTDTVTLWVEGNGNKKFRLRWKRPAVATWDLGDTTINVTLNVMETSDCSSISLGTDYDLELRLWKPFLWVDDDHGSSFQPSGGGGCGASDADEISGGFWNLDPRDVEVSTQCVDKPFSGQGWEGNYDTGQPFTTNSSYENSLSTGTSTFDTYCDGPVSNSGNCVNLKHTTAYSNSPDRREVDVGDMVPWHWNATHHDTLLSRLNPNHGTGQPADFGVANYFSDTPAGSSGSLVPTAGKPLLAAGNSPLGAAALDFRCWYTGSGGNKCNRSGFKNSYDDGFLELLESQDSSLWACRKPFMIVVSDLYHNCTSNSNVAKIAGMYSDTRDTGFANGVSTWLLNLGSEKCGGLTNAGKGETIDVDSKDRLREVLREILGEIEETSRAFAAAAVPTVQADVQDKIYFTQFTPLQNLGLWPGEVLAFKKPLPTVLLTEDGETRLVPDADEKVWDAGIEMMAQSPDPGSVSGPYYSRGDLKIGPQETQRRVYYMVEPGLWNYFAPISGGRTSPVDSSTTYSENELRNDMWEGMGIVNPGPLNNETLAAIQANSVLDGYLTTAHSTLGHTLIEKEAVDSDGVFLRNFILGDIFHSNPQVIGNPTNSFYLSDPVSFPGYEEFATRHEKRRKVLLVGANDGMLHAFDAGRWEGSVDEGEFNNGTGLEIFGYVPREAMTTLREQSASRQDHRWSVDGTAQIADVLIDVDEDGDREWRTIVVGGMRRGGGSYYALDLTQPDPVTEKTRDLGGTTVTVGYLPTSNDVVPACWDDHDTLTSGGTVPDDSDCDTVPYGTPLWEVYDIEDDDGVGSNGRTDMGQSWSSPEIGPIRVQNQVGGLNQTELRWVAIFGGGLDPSWATDSGKGNWLYMVDIETGKIIYKRRLGSEGSAVAPPAAIDTDRDGVLDRLYIGTTHGQLWRIDMSTTPALVDTAANCPKDAYDGMCIDETDADWDPVLFFDTVTTETNDLGDTVQQRRPFFFAPAVFYVGQLGGFGIAVGTGNRDDIWSSGPAGGNRFYIFADEVCKNSTADTSLCQLSTDLPLYESDLVDVTSDTACAGGDVVTDLEEADTGERGWYVRLGQTPVSTDNTLFDASDELLVTPPVAVAGLTVFNTFVPETERTSGSGQEPQCARRGISRSYLYFTASGCNLDVKETGTLVSDVFVERKATQNKSCEEDPDQAHCTSGSTSEDPCTGSEALNQRIRDELFPSTCRFSDIFSFPLMVNQSDVGIKCLVEIPMCIQQRNWKEF